MDFYSSDASADLCRFMYSMAFTFGGVHLIFD